MFSRKKADELREARQFDSIRVGRYFAGCNFLDGETELGIDDLFDVIFDDDIGYLVSAIDGELSVVDYLGQTQPVDPFHALCKVVDQFGLIIRI